MDTCIYSHDTALRAIRSSRKWRGELPWPRCGDEEQREAIAAAKGTKGAVDLSALRSLGFISDIDAARRGDETIHVLVGGRRARRCKYGMLSHVRPVLPPGSLLRASIGTYVCCPELCFAQMGSRLDDTGLLQLGYELAGLYTLDADSDRGFHAAKPALSAGALMRYLESLDRVAGIGRARRIAPYVLERSRSPMESALATLFSLPHVRGGFGVGRPLLNHTIELTDDARVACGRSEIECDAFFEKAGIDLEYNSVYHSDERQRRRDDERQAALACMDILVVRISASQFADLDKLEAIARLIARRSGKSWRIRTDRFRIRQAVLHGALLDAMARGDRGDS